MKYARITSLIICLITTVALAASCSNDSKAKQLLLDTLDKHEQIENHAFSGQLEMELSSFPVDTTGQPYTSVLLNSLKQGSIAWSGAEDKAQQRQEAALRFTTSDGSAEFTVPVIRNESTIYVHIPLINTEQEYFALPAPEQTNHLDRTIISSFARMIEAMNGAWFASSEQDNGGATVTFAIGEKEWLPFLVALKDALPKALEQWVADGFITQAQFDELKQQLDGFASDRGSDLRLSGGKKAQAVVTINPQGFISAIELEIDVEVASQSGDSERYYMKLQHTLDRINEQPEFTRDIPEHTVSFEEILKFIR